jgi:trehalose 6-phosphate synthase
MRRTCGFLVLLLALAFMTWMALVFVQATTRGWFERDITLRARLAVNGARQALLPRWNSGQLEALESVLTEIAQDERIMGVTACAADLIPLAQTAGFPEAISCESLGSHVRPREDAPVERWTGWNSVTCVPGGSVYVSAIPLTYQHVPFGFVVIVHDLTFVERREAKTRRFLLFAFGFLAIATWAITIAGGRLDWRGWTADFRTVGFIQRKNRYPPTAKVDGSPFGGSTRYLKAKGGRTLTS